MFWLPAALWCALVACSGKGDVPDDNPGDTGSTDDPTGSGTGASASGPGPGNGTAAGSGPATGTGTGGTGSGLDCLADYTGQTPAPGAGGDVCVTEDVPGDAEFFHTNAGGSTFYDTETWESLNEAQILEPNDLDGPERVYVVRGLGAGQQVRVELKSCDDMWLSYIVSGDLSEGVCDQTPWGPGGHADGTYTDQHISLPGPGSGTYDIEFIAEGFQGVVTNYKLTVERFP